MAVQGPIAEKVADLSKQAQSCQVLDDRTKRRIGEKHGLQNPNCRRFKTKHRLICGLDSL